MKRIDYKHVTARLEVGRAILPAFMYHFIPFLAAWFSVRIAERHRRLKLMAYGRAA